MSLTRTPTSLMLASGEYFDPHNPQAEDVDLASVAIGLGRIVRFNGQTTRAITVAEHSMRVGLVSHALATTRGWRAYDCRAAHLYGLLHDAEESILGDTPTPIKTAAQRETGDAVRSVIFQALGCDRLLTVMMYREIVKQADAVALAYEALTWQRNAADWVSYPDGLECKPGSLDPDQLVHGWRERRLLRRGDWDRLWLRRTIPLLRYV